MRILFLSMHYRPEPCDTRTSVLAQEMAKRGHQCTALTSFPNYPFGKVYTGYKQRLWNRTQIEGVDVVRVPMVPDHSRSAKRRALSYLSFGFSSALLGAFLTKKPDLIWIHHPPPTTGLAGCIIAKLKRVPYVYEIHDLWPETLMSTGMVKESWVTRAIASVCRFLERGASAIVVTSPGMKSHSHHVRRTLRLRSQKVWQESSTSCSLATSERRKGSTHSSRLRSCLRKTIEFSLS